MEQQNHQTTNDNINTTTNHQDTNTNKTANNNGNSGNGGGFLCSRQSSSRWTPTTEQIRILKELYYNNGVRSPSAEQIQRISARLRQYGKIEGKNVFYWFQNHKARERQKKRFTADIHHNNNINIIRNNNNNNINYNTSATTSSTVGIINTNNTIITTSSACKTHHHHDQYDDDDQHHQEYQLFHHHGASHIKYSNNFSPVVSYGMSCSSSSMSSTSVVGVNGQMGNVQYGYGGVTNMDKAFRECGSSGGVNGGSITQNFGWVGSSDPFSSPYALFDKRSNIALEDDDHDHDHDYHDDHDQASPEIETLPLFPMHGDGGYGNMMIKPDFSDHGAAGYYPGWYRSDDGSGAGGHVSTRTSLELSLNSYGHISPNSL